MKKTSVAAFLIILSQVLTGQINSKLAPYAEDAFYTAQNHLNFVKLNQKSNIRENDAVGFINSIVLNNGPNKVSIQKAEKDELGFTHIKYNVVQNGIYVSNKLIIAHFNNDKLVSLNGDLSNVALAGNNFLITEKKALQFALAKIKAKKYKWENREEELHMRESLNDENFTYYPKGEKVILEKEGKCYNAYRFNIYAEEPLYRANVFVDASSGKILDEQNLICHVNTPATAVTKYSGTQTITADFTGSLYRFRETQRGLGVETYNMKNTSTYSSTDFTNTTSSWTTTGFDQGAADAHWGAEKTYDYYFTQHNRNSINNNGYKLLSYVHYQTNYVNAFWDGQRMTYGDGNGGSYKIFTALDVCGHEITHGLTSNTGNLAYSNESGALNESYSDIFGTAIENFGRPGNWNWKIGEDITSNGFGLRDMSNPSSYGDPDTYGGTNYYTGTADNGGVHTNSGVSNFWFYLLVTGGSGTNDLFNSYSVSGIGMTNAAKIAFRALTVYYTPTTNFASARLLTIQAAKDLFGNCSNEVIQTTKAWYAVGVGANYINGTIGPNFTSNGTNFCSAPASVSFSNITTNGLSYTWNFGDGSTATTTNAVHVYNTPGIYTVKLKANGCASSSDSVIKTAYIVVNAPVSSPVVSGGTGCKNSPVLLSGTASSTIKWYNSPTGGSEIGSGNSFLTPNLGVTTTFYAANTVTVAPVFGGIPSNTGGGFLNSNSNWLVFDVLQNGVLNSVVVYAQTSGNRTVQLRSSTNAVIYSTTANLSVGANTIILNYNLTPGTNYRLGLSTTSASNLYRTNNGVTYPYNIGGCVNITTSNAGGNAYYYFYNWKVSKQECASPRVPVVASVNPLPVVSVSAPLSPVCAGDVIDLQGTPVGGSYIGPAMNGSLFDAALSGAGTHTVSYTYVDANLCSNTAEATLIVEECTGISEAKITGSTVSVYPNPTKDNLFIKSTDAGLKIILSDALGRTVLVRDLTLTEENIKLDSFPKGLYLICVKDGLGKTVKTIKLIKE